VKSPLSEPPANQPLSGLRAVVTGAAVMYSAGAEPTDAKDKYQAWYIGAGVLLSGILIVLWGKSSKRSADGVAVRQQT
jgi:hypothetical protein